MISGTQLLSRYQSFPDEGDGHGDSTRRPTATSSVVGSSRSHQTTKPRPISTEDRYSQRAGGSLYRIKPAFVTSLDGVARRLIAADVSADTITMAALPVQLAAAAAIIAGAFWPLAWVLVGPLLLLLMSVNALDGIVARRTGASNHGGAVRNELVDRAGDATLLVAGFAVAPWPIVVAAIVAVAATEIAALVGWTVTSQRSFPGLMGKPDRAATLAAGATVALFWPQALPIAFLVIAIGASIGSVSRVRRAFALARELDAGGPDVS